MHFKKILKVLIIFKMAAFCYLVYNLTSHVNTLKSKYNELEKEHYELLMGNASINSECSSPSVTYEVSRHRIRSTLQLMWKALNKNIAEQKIPKNAADIIRRSFYEHKISILRDWKQMSLNDGYENWRSRKWKQLETETQLKFHKLQNPENCSSARVLKSTEGYEVCGWGCQFLQYEDKFAAAVAMRRMLVYIKPPNHYYEPDELQRYYKPISETCDFSDPKIIGDPYPGKESSKIVQSLMSMRIADGKYRILSSMVPADVAETAQKVFADPHIWWASQIDKYLLRLNDQTEKILNDTLTQLQFKNPIVGVHIRRGNKVTEVANHEVEEYMQVADEFFDILELTERVEKRRIYLATDEPKVVEEVRTKYPHYEVLTYDYNLNVTQKYQSSKASALRVIIESFLISKCDHFVGTLSSNLGRRCYEFLYWNHHDATERMTSLDFHPFENNDITFKYIAVMPHNKNHPNEIDVKLGDEILSAFTHWVDESYLFGFSVRTKQTGYIPAFKLQRVVTTYDPNEIY